MGHDLKADLLFLTEADSTLGTGHLVETFQIASQCQADGLHPVVLVPQAVSSELLDQAPVPVRKITGLDPSLLAAEMESWIPGVRLIMTNLRQISALQVKALTGAVHKVICLDEFGQRHLPCDVVINPTPVAAYHRYSSDRSGFQIHAGPAYMALHPRYADARLSLKPINGPIRSVLISMGGVDRTGATLRIVEALKEWPSDAKREIVLGALFPWEKELEKLLSGSTASWEIHRHPPSLVDLLRRADVGIAAGGNTLCEMACVGTPAVVLYEDPHEGEQGRAFQSSGFGTCLGAGTQVPGHLLREALDHLEDPQTRRTQGQAGMRLVDGQGISRIGRIVAEQLSIDSILTS